MKKTIIEGVEYFPTSLGYSHAGKTIRFTVYATDPYDVDQMINRLVEFRAEKIAQDKLTSLITEKVKHFLGL